MYTQNTPVHVKLWHRDFWLMATANLLVTMAMYIQLPLLPGWLMSATGCTPGLAAVAVGAPGVAYSRSVVSARTLYSVTAATWCASFRCWSWLCAFIYYHGLTAAPCFRPTVY